jgi:hypothetical protein
VVLAGCGVPKGLSALGTSVSSGSADDDGSLLVELAEVGPGIDVVHDRVGRCAFHQAGQTEVGACAPGRGGDRLVR